MILTAREMMLGLRDEFTYLECDRCGCLQLLDSPGDWLRYYPRDYYSFSVTPDNPIRRLLKRWRSRHAMGIHSLAGALLVKGWGVPPFVQWIEGAGVTWDDAILDVGAGSGQLLLEMRDAGFSNLTGIDPYIEADCVLGPGVRVLKRYIADLRGSFDFVMMNHSFEHLDNPEPTLAAAARLLPEGCVLLIRTPVAGKYAWREFRSQWVQLDAPRHVFLHTESSIRMLADRTGFTVRDIRYDSTGFQFWGSEQYQLDIPLHDARSYAINPRRSRFSKKVIMDFEHRAHELNEQGDGDQACFYLVRR